MKINQNNNEVGYQYDSIWQISFKKSVSQSVVFLSLSTQGSVIKYNRPSSLRSLDIRSSILHVLHPHGCAYLGSAPPALAFSAVHAGATAFGDFQNFDLAIISRFLNSFWCSWYWLVVLECPGTLIYDAKTMFWRLAARHTSGGRSGEVHALSAKNEKYRGS